MNLILKKNGADEKSKIQSIELQSRSNSQGGRDMLDQEKWKKVWLTSKRMMGVKMVIQPSQLGSKNDSLQYV